MQFSAALTLLLVVLVGGCGESSQSAPRNADIVLIVLDTVRRDRISAYGYERKTTPNFDRLAATGRLFLDVHASGGWTAPSHASMFTGYYPIRHRATQEGMALDDELSTLAELLSEAGYQTFGVTGNAMITVAHGFSQGFDVYRESWRDVQHRERDRATVESVAELLAGRDPERPYFLFVNLIGAHTPFDSCGSNCGAFGASLDGGLRDSQWQNFYLGRRAFDDADYERLGRLYDQELREVDANLGRLLGAIAKNRSAGGSAPFIVVTSDHGENLGDHRHVNHVFSLYETTTRVPLVVHRAGSLAGGGEDRQPRQLIDLFPTILRVAGVEIPDSRHALGIFRAPPADRVVVSEYYRPDQAFSAMPEDASEQELRRIARYQRRVRTVSRDGWKLHWGSDGKHELYELAVDPDEATNRIDDPEAVQVRVELERALLAFVEEHGEGREDALEPVPDSGAPGVPLDPETAAELRALGYAD